MQNRRNIILKVTKFHCFLMSRLLYSTVKPEIKHHRYIMKNLVIVRKNTEFDSMNLKTDLNLELQIVYKLNYKMNDI